MLASRIIEELWASGTHAISITPAGSVRRSAPDVSDIALLGITAPGRGDDFLTVSTRLPSVRRVVSRTATTVTLSTDRGDLSVHTAEPSSAGAALLCLTGSPGHVSVLTRLAQERGLRLGTGRLTDPLGVLVECRTEAEVYGRLGLPFIPPELRHGGDEIEAAFEGRLPALLTDMHIRGDLHMHSTWSDGRDSIAVMVHASQALGYEYIAITDHSQSALSSRKMAADDVPQQRTEITHIRRRHPRIQILHGVEVDILKDGSLDFEDAVLEGFDIVLASLHDHAGHQADVLTERCLRAIASPYVNVITHPANRSPAASSGYDLDFDRIFAAAVETGTALEIDGAPGHLDMDGALARRAVAAGVTVVVDSDCHRADALGRQMRFGVATARRGWLEPRHVLNTQPVEQVREFVARKRARG